MPARKRQKDSRPKIYALILIDAQAIRRNAAKACKHARRTFEKAEKELLDFEKSDVPAYERWRRGTFGPQLQQEENLRLEVERVKHRLERMLMLRLQNGYSGEEAMEQVLLEEKEGHEEEEPDPLEEELQRKEAERHRKKKEAHWKALVFEFGEALRYSVKSFRQELESGGTVEYIRELFSDYFWKSLALPPEMASMFFAREDVEALWGKYGLAQEVSALSAAAESVEARIKRLMRELAFALHPDRSDGKDERKLELWHHVQAAVKAMDLDRLEVLHAHMQLLTGDLGPGLSVGRILDLTANYRESREALRRKIRAARKSPQWGFAKAAPEEVEREKVRQRREIQHILLELQDELHRMEQACADMADDNSSRADVLLWNLLNMR